MKKVLLSLVAVFAIALGANAQTEQGNKFVEINTGFGAGPGGTGLAFSSQDGTSSLNLGAEGGYFIADGLAAKLGLGIGSVKPDGGDAISTITYKVGAKYYVNNIIPVEVSLNGSSTKDAVENPLWLGLQGGYALWLSEKVSLEPGLRYNLSLNEDYTDKGLLQGNVGFGFYF